MQNARGMLVNARKMYGSGYKVPEECMGMQGNLTVTYVGGCKVPGECRDYQGNESERIQSARGMHGNAGESQENVRVSKVPGECKGMPGERKGLGAIAR